MELSEFRLAPINRKPHIIETLANVPNGTFAVFTEFVSRVGVEDLRLFDDRELEVEIREQFNQMRSYPDLRAIHDYSNNWFGIPTRATISLLWTWGYIDRPEHMVEGEEFDLDRCQQLLYAQEIALPEGLTLVQLGGLEWAARASLTVGRPTGIIHATHH
jgi:hypothetical protein